MTDDKQDPSVVAWRTDIFESLPNGKLSRLILEAEEVNDPDPDWKSLSLTSDLTAMKAELEEAKKERDAQNTLIGRTAVNMPQGAREVEFLPENVMHLRRRAEAVEQERDELREALKSARDWLPTIEPIMHDTPIFKRDLAKIDAALSKPKAP